MKKIYIVLLLFIVTLLVGCTGKEKEITDRYGEKIKVPNKMERIIASVPSNTDILVGLGLGDKLVAIDIYATDIQGVNPDAAKLDFMTPDIEALVALKPDIVIASELNKISGQDPFAVLKDSGISVVYMPSSENIDSIYKDIEFLGLLTGNEDTAKKMNETMKTEIDKIKAVTEKITEKKRVYFEISPAPSLYSFGSGTFFSELLDIAGGVNIFADQNSWIAPSEESIIEANPDVILSTVNYIDNPIDEIKSRPSWDTLDAVKNNQIFIINPNYASRSSQNVVLGLKEMVEALYPELYGK